MNWPERNWDLWIHDGLQIDQRDFDFERMGSSFGQIWICPWSLEILPEGYSSSLPICVDSGKVEIFQAKVCMRWINKRIGHEKLKLSSKGDLQGAYEIMWNLSVTERVYKGVQAYANVSRYWKLNLVLTLFKNSRQLWIDEGCEANIRLDFSAQNLRTTGYLLLPCPY